MKELDTSLHHQMRELGTSLQQDITGLRQEMKNLEYRLIFQLGVVVTAIIAAFKLLGTVKLTVSEPISGTQRSEGRRLRA